jgi:hypothetical protein
VLIGILIRKELDVRSIFHMAEPGNCPVAALGGWMLLSGNEGPVFGRLTAIATFEPSGKMSPL